MKKGNAQPQFIYRDWFIFAIISLLISIVSLIIFPFSQPVDLLYASFFPILTILLIVYGLRCYEKFYINNDEIIIKNCFKTLKKISLTEIKSIYISSVKIGRTHFKDIYKEYVVISTRSTMVEQDRFLNSQNRLVITVHASPDNISLINEWSGNKINFNVLSGFLIEN